MTLKDALDVLDDLVEEQREIVIAALLDNLTQFSHYAILEAQLSWDGRQPYEKFIKFQNEVIRECVKIEKSPFGVILRREYQMEPLTELTELELSKD